jgi:hypothetical protein
MVARLGRDETAALDALLGVFHAALEARST